MKKILQIAFIALLFYSDIVSQNITFDKSYTQFTNYKTIGVVQRQDSSFLFASYMNDVLKTIQIDKHGIISGESEVPFKIPYINLANKNPLCINSDKGFTVVSSIQNGDDINSNVDIVLSKFNNENNLVWQKTFGDTLIDDYGMMVTQTDDNGFILLAGRYNSLTYFHNVYLIRTDENGTVLWKRNFEKPAVGSRSAFSLIRLNNGDYLCSKGTYIYCFNQMGDSLWTANVEYTINNLSPLSGGGFLSCSDKFIFILDEQGNVIKKKEFSSKLKDMEETADGKIALVSDGQNNRYLRILDKDFNIVQEKSLGYSFFAQQVDITSDKGLVICGQNGSVTEFSPQIIKTDSLFLIKKLAFSELETIYQEGRSYYITWESEAVDKVDLYYSTDNGITWLEIIKALPNANEYIWLVLATPSSECLLKIADSDSPDFNYVSNSAFSIRYHDYMNYLSVNQVQMWITNDGMGSYDPVREGSGLLWPGGFYASIAAVFSDGLVWGGNVNGKILVNGNTHRGGLQPGKILRDGTADDPLKAEYVIWKINQDWFSFPIYEEREKLRYNLINWPGELGAPYEDVNSDGQFTKDIDKPKFYGDETLWFVANDLDTAISHRAYGSDPIGLEVQVTSYAYNRTDILADVVFKKYNLINKSGNNIYDMYLGYWADCDLGYANDDFIGCDTILNLGYTYNSDNDDNWEYGTNPPTIGYLLLQGPTIKTNSLDSAFYNERWIKGFKNLQMTSFTPFVKNSNFRDADQGQYSGTIQFYNYLRGLDYNGDAVINPWTNSVTKYGVSGDPVAKSGWFEGEVGWPNGTNTGDRRQMISSGPFTLSAGDTQQVVIAIIMARGESNLESVSILKDRSKAITNFYYNGVLSDVKDDIQLPKEFVLYQNYPNPFNPTTTIKYSVPEKSNVQITVYDVLGREVTTLVNKEQLAGTYEVKFSANGGSASGRDGSKLSSGVYFYQLKVGSFEATRKLLLVK